MSGQSYQHIGKDGQWRQSDSAVAPKLKTYIVPVIHVMHFGTEVRVQAANRQEAAKLARVGNAEMASGDGYDWNRASLARVIRGDWDRIKEEAPDA